MSNTNWNVNVVSGAVQVTDDLGNVISPTLSIDELDGDTITFVPGSGVTIQSVTISDATWTGGSGTYTSDQAWPGILSITWRSGNVVLTDLDSSATASYDYKVGIKVQYEGNTYPWDPTVHEKPPGG